MAFRLLDRTDLIVKDWNDSILSANNGRVNALSWYLDIVCDQNWKALIFGDYEYVIALPINNRIPFVPRISIPYYSQQLGIIGKTPADDALVSAALDKIPAYRQVIMQWNEFNLIPENVVFKTTMRPNYVLDLHNTLESIRAGYSKTLKRHLKKAPDNGLVYKEVSIETFESFFLKNTDKQTKVTEKYKNMLSKLIRALDKNGCAMIRGIYVEDRLIATCLFTDFNKRLCSLMIRSNNEGKNLNAMHYLIDQTIDQYAGTKYLLDFEGSSIENIARFFKSFGAASKPYPLLEKSRFPF